MTLITVFSPTASNKVSFYNICMILILMNYFVMMAGSSQVPHKVFKGAFCSFGEEILTRSEKILFDFLMQKQIK